MRAVGDVTPSNPSPGTGEGGTRAASAAWEGEGHHPVSLTIFPYIVDFVCLRSKLIVEADGSQHADSRDDARRGLMLARRGFRVLRFWNNDVLASTDEVAAAIYAALEDPHPPTASRRAPPSPRQGEGLFGGAPHG